MPPAWNPPKLLLVIVSGLHVVVGTVVDLRLTVEWGVGMRRQDPSYGVVVHIRGLRVQALLGGSNSPTSRSPEAVEWIMNV